MVKAVIFDVDGTLLDSERVYVEAWRQAGTAFGYTIPDEALLRTRAVSSAVAVQVFRETVAEDFPYDRIRQERIRIAEEIIARTPAEALIMPGAKQVLAWLRQRGVSVAVASSTPYEKTVSHLRHAGLIDCFGAVVCGDMVERGKPAPDIFLKAAALLGVEPDACLVVGDTPADVFAGSAAGMRVILIPDQVPANPETTARSLHVMADMTQLHHWMTENL